MAINAYLGDDVAVDEDDVEVPEGDVVVANCDDVEVGTKKKSVAESLNEESEGEVEDSVNEGSECEDEVRMQVDYHGSDKGPFFVLGMTFANHEELKRAINQYAIMYGVKIGICKSEPSRIRVICQKGCPFVLYASKEGANPGLKVKTLCYEHRCLRVYKNPRASARWLAGYFKNKIQERPRYKVSDMKKDVEVDLKLHVSLHKCKRAKKLIMKEMEGSYKDEFGNLEAYCNELRTSNPSSDVNVEVSKEALEDGRRDTSTCKEQVQMMHVHPSTSTNASGKKRGRPKKVSSNASQDAQLSQITQEAISQPITPRPRLTTRSSYKKRVECGMGIRVDLEQNRPC